MLTDFESGKINTCISKDLSRLGRNAIDTGFYIEKYFPTHGIRYIAINDNYDSAVENGGIMVSLQNMMNETYALETGRKIHKTKQLNIKNGCFVGARPPYGYLKSCEDSHRLVPDPYAAPIVSRMFEMTANGESVSDVHAWLNANSVLPPLRYHFSIGIASEKMARGNENWCKTMIYTILKNQIYTGDMIQGKFRT
jgi:DNA invertase Pin-like site-specific DNA recombinase